MQPSLSISFVEVILPCSAQKHFQSVVITYPDTRSIVRAIRSPKPFWRLIAFDFVMSSPRVCHPATLSSPLKLSGRNGTAHKETSGQRKGHVTLYAAIWLDDISWRYHIFSALYKSTANLPGVLLEVISGGALLPCRLIPMSSAEVAEHEPQPFCFPGLLQCNLRLSIAFWYAFQHTSAHLPNSGSSIPL